MALLSYNYRQSLASFTTSWGELGCKPNPCELKVLPLIAEGQTNQQIAKTLIISVGTVKSYTSPIYGKLATNHHDQAVARGRALGLLWSDVMVHRPKNRQDLQDYSD